jgi:hypothetical protein
MGLKPKSRWVIPLPELKLGAIYSWSQAKLGAKEKINQVLNIL